MFKGKYFPHYFFAMKLSSESNLLTMFVLTCSERKVGQDYILGCGLRHSLGCPYIQGHLVRAFQRACRQTESHD